MAGAIIRSCGARFARGEEEGGSDRYPWCTVWASLSLSPFSLLGTSLSSGFIKTSNYNLIINLSPLQVPSKRPNENHSSAIFPSFDPEYWIDLYSSFLRFVRLRKKKRKKGITFSFSSFLSRFSLQASR